MTDVKNVWEELRKPFPADDIEWRIQQSGVKNGKGWGMVLGYVTNRAIQQRLDDIVGPDNWKNQFNTGPDNGVLCGLSIRVSHPNEEDHEWITKYDGAENTNIEAVKGGLSGSMKRAAVQWGIGRYLYNLDPIFVQISSEKGDNWISIKYEDNREKKKLNGYWDDPSLPDWALPSSERVQKDSLKKSTSASQGSLIHPALMQELKDKLRKKQILGDFATTFVQATIGHPTPSSNADAQKIIDALNQLDTETGEFDAADAVDGSA